MGNTDRTIEKRHPEDQTRDREVRDDVVPALGYRVRGGTAVWVVHLKRDGKRTKVTLGSAATIPIDRARALARDLLAEPTEALRPTSMGTVEAFAETFLQDCAHQWKPSTRATNRRCVKQHILPTFGKRALMDITPDNVRDWVTDAKAAPGARNRALPVLSSMMTHAEICGLRPADSNPCQGMRRRKTAFEAAYLDAAGFADLGRALEALSKAHPREAAALRFLALTGARKGEALALEWSMIEKTRAALPDSKSGPRSIWLGRPAKRLLATLPREGRFVFGDEEPLAVYPLNRAWWTVRTAMKKPKLRIHDLRHSFASVAVGQGVDLLVVGGLLGHADKGSTAGYAHLDQAAMKAASKRVGTHLEKVRAPKRRRPARRKPKPRSVFKEFIQSKDRLTAFCQARGLDAGTFQKDLVAWRETQAGGRP